MVKTINLPKSILRKGPVVVIPLKDWERLIENIEMLQAKKLSQEIKSRRKNKKLISLSSVLKKYKIE